MWAIVPSFDSLFPDRLAGDPLWRVVFGYSPLVYFALIMVFAVGWFLNRTRAGLILRAVGENDLSAHSIGYSVIAIRYAAIAFGGAMAGIGGAYFSMVMTPLWAEANDRGPRLDRPRARGVLRLASRAAAGGRLLFRPAVDARALCQGVRLLVPAVRVLGGDALYRNRRRPRRHFRRKVAGSEAPACLGRPFLPNS